MMWIVILGAAAVALASSSDKPKTKATRIDRDALKKALESRQ
jgi:hypothetical protein